MKFAEAFDNSDVLVITKLYPAGEPPIPGVSEELIFRALERRGHPSLHLIRESEEVLAFLRNELKRGDLLVTLGAGSVWRIGREFLQER
jgi:UDP-N-acetylmuramate--alanine ligase